MKAPHLRRGTRRLRDAEVLRLHVTPRPSTSTAAKPAKPPWLAQATWKGGGRKHHNASPSITRTDTDAILHTHFSLPQFPLSGDRRESQASDRPQRSLRRISTSNQTLKPLTD